MGDFFSVELVINFVRMFFKVMFLLICLSNIILLFSPSSFSKISKRLHSKYGPKVIMLPWLESDVMVVDEFLFKHRVFMGVCSFIASVALFAIY